MSEVTYNDDKLIGGQYFTDQVKLAADTYFRGMPLTFDGTRYIYTADLSLVNAIWLEEERDVVLDGAGAVIRWGEVLDGGLVNDSGVALVLTDINIATLNKTGSPFAKLSCSCCL